MLTQQLAQNFATETQTTTNSRAANSSAFASELRSLWHKHRLRIFFTYALFNIENIVRLSQPLLLGWAINDLLRTSYVGLIVFACGHLLHLLLRTSRQMYDTRTFTRIYADRATDLVLEQRNGGEVVSKVAARTSLSRQFVEFLERDVPVMIRSLYSIVGALLLIAFFDWVIVLFCLGIMLPACVLNFVYGRRTLAISGRLHDDMEREVEVVREADESDVREHFENLAKSQIKMSDWEAATVGVMELFVLGLMVGALVRFCTIPSVAAGDIFAVFRYVLMFVMALDSMPILVQKTSRLRDIGRRIRSTASDCQSQ